MSIERKRTENVSNQMRNRGIDALLIFSPQNIRYLTAFSQACEVAIIPAEGEPTVLGLWLDVASARGSTWIEDIRSFIPRYAPRVDGGRNELMKVAEIVGDRSFAKGTLGVEMGHVRYRQLELLKSDLPDAKFVDVSGMLAEMRIVKSAEEIDLIRKSIKIAEGAMDAAVKALKVGATEAEVAAEADREIERKGVEVASRTMVASGGRTLQIHPYPTLKKISKGELVAIDVHARYEGYCSDVARTCVMGKAGREQTAAFETLLEAQSAGFEAMRLGVSTGVVYEAARKVIDGAGYRRHFPELYGHGVGLDVEDLPKIAPGWEISLSPNVPVALFQGPISLPKVGGVRLEDIALVTKAKPEMLTKYPRKLVEI